jgi:Fe-S-cluster containining protein
VSPHAQLPSRCCHGFILPEYNCFGALRAGFKRKLKDLRQRVADQNPHGIPILVESLRTMQLLIPITYTGLTQDLRAALDERTLGGLDRDRQEAIWSCKAFDPITGRCGIYPHRPSMCTSFPDNDIHNRERGHNTLCLRCSSTYCTFHPEHKP